jgi:FtsH-binding integral membrane protein
MTPGQALLLERALTLVLLLLGSASISAWVFKEIRGCGFLIGTFIASILGIFLMYGAATTGNIALITLASVFFGGSVGATLGSFAIAVGESKGLNTTKIVQAVAITIGTVFLATLLAGMIGLFSGVNFQGLGSILFMGLFVLIGISLLGIVVKNSLWMEMALGIGASIFWVIYLIYDFNKIVTRFVETNGEWTHAVEVAMGIFLDMINLFIRLLPIIMEIMAD